MLFNQVLFISPPAAAKWGSYAGTPRAPARDFVPCTPYVRANGVAALQLKHGGFHVFAEDSAKDIHDFTESGVGFDGFDDGGHGVFCSLGNSLQVLQ